MRPLTDEELNRTADIYCWLNKLTFEQFASLVVAGDIQVRPTAPAIEHCISVSHSGQ